MNKTLLIARHEFSKTIKRTAFIILTLALPILGFAGVLIYNAVQGGGAPEELAVGYVDESGLFANATNPPGADLIPYPTEAEAKNALLTGDISEYFVIPQNYLHSGIITRYTMEREIEPPGGHYRADTRLPGEQPVGGRGYRS